MARENRTFARTQDSNLEPPVSLDGCAAVTPARARHSSVETVGIEPTAAGLQSSLATMEHESPCADRGHRSRRHPFRRSCPQCTSLARPASDAGDGVPPSQARLRLRSFTPLLSSQRSSLYERLVGSSGIEPESLGCLRYSAPSYRRRGTHVVLPQGWRDSNPRRTVLGTAALAAGRHPIDAVRCCLQF